MKKENLVGGTDKQDTGRLLVRVDLERRTRQTMNWVEVPRLASLVYCQRTYTASQWLEVTFYPKAPCDYCRGAELECSIASKQGERLRRNRLADFEL